MSAAQTIAQHKWPQVNRDFHLRSTRSWQYTPDDVSLEGAAAGYAAGLSGIYYGLDVVEEFRMVVSSGQAELGRARWRLHQHGHLALRLTF